MKHPLITATPIKKNPRIDDYIDRAQPFAKPILEHLRNLVHIANPEVEETIKWGFASYDYKGPYCSMAAFKQHVAFGFWKAALLTDPYGYLGERSNNGGEAMGHFGRITSLTDLPPDPVIIDFIRQAKDLNDQGIKLPPRPTSAKKPLVVPDFFLEAIQKDAQARTTFTNFSESNKREYVEWILEAKTESTRQKRLATALIWIGEGKIRNWKYVKKK
jgi:uncharacterized protein YdeI (YjbR/CyaY-like superfamily)